MKDYQVAEWAEIVGQAEHRLKHSSFFPAVEDETIVAAAKEMQMMRDFIYKVANEEVTSEYVSFHATALLGQILE